MTEIIVRREPDGKTTVCVDEHCVTIECAQPDPAPEEPEPPFGIYLREEALADLDPAALEWTETGAQLRRSEHRGQWIWHYRLDD